MSEPRDVEMPTNAEAKRLDLVARLPDTETESRIFWRMRGRIARTQVLQAISRSRLRSGLVVTLSLLLWIAMFWLFLDGFRFLESTVRETNSYNMVIQAVFAMFFTALMVMLVFSSAILVYGFLFRARDLTFLLTLPARIERVFVYKFQETVFFSGWAFFLLGTPMLLAYGIIGHAPWYYYAMLLPFLFAFTYIPTGVGALTCLLVVYYLPRKRHYVLGITLGVALIVAVWFGWSILTSTRGEMFMPIQIRQTVSRLHFSEQQLLPSWWLSSGLLEAAHRGWRESVLYFCLLTANALLLRQMTIWCAGRFYRTAYNQLAGMGSARRKTRPMWMDRVVERTMLFPVAVRLMWIKDARLFRRDPAQWTQFLLFFALLAFYFLNIRRFESHSESFGWVNMMSFVNLTVVGLILSTLTTRHVFPMMSLEGQRIWLVGLLGVSRGTILWSKFGFALACSLVPCALLVLLSDLMLGVRESLQASHQAACFLLCLGLSGIAVGLGAKMPNLHETSLPRIAAGFGGTLNLVVSSLYILLIVMTVAMPWHLHDLAQNEQAAEFLAGRPNLVISLRLWLWGGTMGGVLLGILATVLPLWMGLRAFRRLEV